MRTATQIRAHAETYDAPKRGSGRRLKAATESNKRSELARAMSDALEDILEDERRSA